MPADLPTLLTPFKRQLAELQDSHAKGALTKAQLELQTAALERRLLDLLLHDTDAPAGQAAGRKASGRLLAGIASAIVLIAGAGYWFTGMPAQDAPVASEAEGQPNAAQIIAMVDKLAERLKQDPSDADGWAMLARSYSFLQRSPEAVDAYAQAVALRKDDATLLVDYADALAAKNNHNLAGEPMKLVARALKLEPGNIKGLALAGTDAFIRQDFAQAVRYWSEVEKVGAPDSALVQRVTASLQEARSRAGLPAAPGPLTAPAPQQAPAAQAAPGAAAASVSGTVTLSAALLAKASPQDTVFIFARPANGGRVPLAAQRVQVKDLPYRFTLDDSKSMSSSALLSSSAQVVLGARISKSGDAIPQPGDLSGQVGPVALGAKGIALEINEVRKP